MSEVSTKNSGVAPKTTAVPAKKGAAVKANADDPNGGAETPAAKEIATAAPTYAQVKGLLTTYTCVACHNADKKQIGPAFRDIAKRKYSAEKIVSLIHNPQPQNWPGYSTEMPPMPQVTKADGLKIAAWINSLAK